MDRSILAVYVVWPHQDTSKSQFLYDAAGFFDRGGDIVRRDDGSSVHAIGSHFAKVAHPVVVGFGDGRSEFRVQAVDGENEQPAAG